MYLPDFESLEGKALRGPRKSIARPSGFSLGVWGFGSLGFRSLGFRSLWFRGFGA